MSLKRPRMHQCGFTNVDFRSKGDIENIKMFDPWKYPLNFGTMGKSYYAPSFTEQKKMFSVSKTRNKLHNIVQNVPDKKEYAATLFYKSKKINPLLVSEFRVDRVAELDESAIGKDKFTGDSLMFADTHKFRLERKTKKYKNDALEHKKLLQERMDNLEQSKTKQNKEAIQETQIVSLNLKETLEGKIDLNKLKEIRLSLRRRFANRTNFRKVFKEWDRSVKGKLTVYDLHAMLGKMSIPINFNEARVLIASVSKRGVDNLNLEEFTDLILKGDENIKVDLKNIEYKDEDFFVHEKEMENIKNQMKLHIQEVSKSDELQTIKTHIRTRVSIINLEINNKKINASACSKQTFLELIRLMRLPEKFYRDVVVDSLFKAYLNEDQTTMNAGKFFDDCVKMKEENDFADFNNRMLVHLKNKIDRCPEERSDVSSMFKIKTNLQKEYSTDLQNQIIENKKIEEKILKEEDEKCAKEVLNPQPSTAFINQVFKNHREMFNELNRVENTFSPNPNLLRSVPISTRFSSRPEHKDTFYMINQDPKGSSFITEKERFDIKGMNSISDFVLKDKENKRLKQLARYRKFRKYEELRDNAFENFNKALTLKDKQSQMLRMKSRFNYEWQNKINNEFVE